MEKSNNSRTNINNLIISGIILILSISIIINNETLNKKITNKETEKKITLEEIIYQEEYNLLEDTSLEIIKINNNSKPTYHLVKIFNENDLKKLDKKYNMYSYEHEDTYNKTFYIDLYNTEILLIEIEENEYLLNELLDKRKAIDYAYAYYGIKRSYTYNELKNMINTMNESEYVLRRR